MIVKFEDEEVDSIVTTLINDIDYWHLLYRLIMI